MLLIISGIFNITCGFNGLGGYSGTIFSVCIQFWKMVMQEEKKKVKHRFVMKYFAAALAVMCMGTQTLAGQGDAQDEFSPEKYEAVLEKLTETSRWAGTAEERESADWIAEVFSGFGYETELQPFTFTENAKGRQDSEDAVNVIAVKRADKNPNGDILILSAHHDSIECTVGAVDDASGTALLLELARVLRNVESDTEIRFVSFSAEEEGLRGSDYYVEQLTEEEKSHIIGDIQMDMIGHCRADSSIVCTAVGNEQLLGRMLVEASGAEGETAWETYVETASDHASFAFAGIPAVLVTQNCGTGTENHRFIDQSNMVDAEKAVAAGKVILQTVTDIASEATASLAEEAAAMSNAGEAVPIRENTPLLFGVEKETVEVKIGATAVFEKETSCEFGYDQLHYLLKTAWFDWEPLVTDFLYRKVDDNLMLDQVFIRTDELGLSDEELGQKLTEALGAPEIYEDGEKLWGEGTMAGNPSLRQYRITTSDDKQVIEVVSYIHTTMGEDITVFDFKKPVEEYTDTGDAADRALLETLHKVILPEDPYITSIISWTDGYSNELGFCSADDITRSDSFSIRMDKNDFFDQQGNMREEGKFLATAIHEYGHSLTLNAEQLDLAKVEEHSSYNDISLYSQDSYMKVFYDRFYAGGKQRDYFEHPEDYTSSYGGQAGIAEDVAETFMQFVIGGKPDSDTLAAQKINFFYEYPELVEIRAYIRKNFGYPAE